MKRLRDNLICLLFLILAVCCIFISGSQIDYINSQREEMKLVSNTALENAPPALAFATVAMGTFRGLVVSTLWIRADRLKEKGQFFDAKQLADWITTLQPRFASVWEFQAWNMAYNISVAIPNTQPDQRWHWVRNGYELLRDQGIQLNPNSLQLYRELARIFQHKIGGVTDDVHYYYKLQLALEMEPLLGPATNEFFEALGKTPQQWSQIRNDPAYATLINELKQADSAFMKDDDFVGSYLALRQNPARFNTEAVQVIEDFAGTETLKKMDLFAKAFQLRNEWKFDPQLMNELNRKYGPVPGNDLSVRLPLDWRHPDVHAIYWASKGLQQAGGEMDAERYSVAETNTDRIIMHSLQNLFRYGKIYIYTPTDETQAKRIFVRPDLRMFDSYNEATLKIIEKYKEEGSEREIAMQNGHRNMLVNAVGSFYHAGHKNKAARIHNQLQELYNLREHNVPLAVFVANRMREELQSLSIYNALEMVHSSLRESYFRFAMREDDAAAAREDIARQVWQFYQTEYRNEERINLPELERLRYFALIDFLEDDTLPLDLRQSLIARIEHERPDLAERLRRQAEIIFNQLEQSNDRQHD